MGNSEIPSREQIRKMPYLACVIRESAKQNGRKLGLGTNRFLGLRLYPPVPLNNREAVKTTILPTGGGPDGNSPILVQRERLLYFRSMSTHEKLTYMGLMPTTSALNGGKGENSRTLVGLIFHSMVDQDNVLAKILRSCRCLIPS